MSSQPLHGGDAEGHVAAEAVRLTIIVAVFRAVAAPSLCKHQGCLKYAQYGQEGEGTRDFCSIHRHPHHVDQINAKCWFMGCSKGATFMVSGAEKTQCCRAHRTEGMVPVKGWKPVLRKEVNPREECREPGCSVTASYGDAVTRQRIACKVHRQPHHVSLKHLLCADGCGRRAYFGPDNCYGKPLRGNLLYCKEHRRPGHVNVISARCGEEGCRKRALARTLLRGGGLHVGFCKAHLELSDRGPSGDGYAKLRNASAGGYVELRNPKGDGGLKLSNARGRQRETVEGSSLAGDWPWNPAALDLNPLAVQSEALDRLPCAFCTTPIDDHSGFVLYPCHHMYHEWCSSAGACWACNQPALPP